MFLIFACLALIGCAHFGKPSAASEKPSSASGKPSAAVVNKAAPAAEKSSFFSKFHGFSLANLLPGPGVKIVKVREKDLKELPTGRERALAYQNSRKGGFWIFGGSVDFKEPKLPEAGTESDGSLLPPKIQ